MYLIWFLQDGTLIILNNAQIIKISKYHFLQSYLQYKSKPFFGDLELHQASCHLTLQLDMQVNIFIFLAQVADKLKDLSDQEKEKKLKQSAQAEKLDEEKKKLEFIVEEAEEELEELHEIQVLAHKKKEEMTLLDRIKLLIYEKLQHYGFITVLLCASIPNPLFDLAGITCGHFKIPFRTFFSATFLGKSVIKVHIQMLFVISIFRKQSVDYLLHKVNQWIPSLEQKLSDMLQKQKKLLYSPQSFQDNKPIIAKIWDFVLIAMILYFVISIINTSIQHRLVQKKIKKHLKLKEN